MLRRFMFAVLVLCFPFAAIAKSPSETLQSAQTKIDSTLQNAPEKGSAEAKKRRATLEAEAKKLFEFETLAQKALGKNWDTGSADQQKEFVSLFSLLVRDTYLSQIEGNSAKGFEHSFKGEELSGDLAVVKASVDGKTAEGKDVHIKMSYKMISKPSGWMVYDVVTDDSSLLSTYQDTFNKMFKKEGSFENVLVKLRAKTGQKAPVAAPAEASPEAPAGFRAPTPPPVKVPTKVEAKPETKAPVKTSAKVEKSIFAVFVSALPLDGMLFLHGLFQHEAALAMSPISLGFRFLLPSFNASMFVAS